MSKKLKVATVGTGYFSQFHHDAWQRCDDVSIVGVADLQQSKADKTSRSCASQAFTSVSDMLEQTKPDLLDIITPPSTHLELISLAADFGINVVCQKPFCGSLENAKQALQFTDKIDVTVHENFRFQPWYEVLKNNLSTLGQPYRATFRLRPGDGQGPKAYLERQPYFQTMDRFLIHETAIHYVDVFRFLFGEPLRVFADLKRLNPAIQGEDSAIILLEFENMTGVIDANRLSDHKAQNRRLTMGEILVEGQNCVLFLNGDADITTRAHGANEERKIKYEWKDQGFGGDCVYRFSRHIVDHYLHGADRMNSAEDYIRNLQIEEAIYASSVEGAWIEV